MKFKYYLNENSLKDFNKKYAKNPKKDMSFKYFLDNTDHTDLSDLIKKKAKPFMNEFGNLYYNNKFIYRGVELKPKLYTIKKARTDRKPRFVDNNLHKYLSKISKEIFGWDIRTQGVFTGDSHTASTFGYMTIFIPLGKYKYVYSERFDEAYLRYSSIDLVGKKRYEKNKKELYNIYKNQYKTSNLSATIKKDVAFESIFKCDNYVLINPKFYLYIYKKRRSLVGIK